VYGVDGPGPNPSGSPVNQLRTLTKGSSVFKVRLFEGSDDPTAAYLASATTASEWNRLLTRCTIAAIEKAGRTWDDFLEASLTTLNSANYGAAAWVQELGSSSTARRTRGSSTSVLTNSSSAATTASTGLGWRPVLELIP
jgi:hypothetical protein